MIRSTDITKILTAAAPIVASIVAICNKSENNDRKDKSEPSVIINNTFYTNSEQDAYRAAKIIKEQVANSAYYSETRYML